MKTSLTGDDGGLGSSAVKPVPAVRPRVRTRLIEAGSNPLTVPAEFLPVEQVPKLGSGKTDFGAARRLAASLAAGA